MAHGDYETRKHKGVREKTGERTAPVRVRRKITEQGTEHINPSKGFKSRNFMLISCKVKGKVRTKCK